MRAAGRNFKSWRQSRKLDPEKSLFAFERGKRYRIRAVREVSKMSLFVDDRLVAQMSRSEWGNVGTNSDLERTKHMKYGTGRIQLLTWTPLLVYDVAMTGKLNRRWLQDRRAELKKEEK